MIDKNPFDVLKRVLNMMIYMHTINTSLESNNENDDDVICKHDLYCFSNANINFFIVKNNFLRILLVFVK
jgi:hypothetical protein